MLQVPDPALIASIRIFFQPIIRLGDLRPDYVEVLARAAAPDGSLAGPESIVDAMTNAEHSMGLTAGIMQRTLEEYASFNFAESDLAVAFNLPLDAMLHPELIERLDRVRENSNIPTRNIRFELTERHPVHDIGAACNVISTLRTAGYGLALDDITPDMPNLPALMQMPIRAIKLDRSVVISHAGQPFIRDMVAKATEHDQDIIAEGIETAELRDNMRNLGVTHGQGFLFSRPLPAPALQTFLRGFEAVH
jgi:EAL domain-containing protein (putative c-di-GMP-specific phosphodiesterase class I)